eukprot:c12665_g2_i1 orf=1-180(-)
MPTSIKQEQMPDAELCLRSEADTHNEFVILCLLYIKMNFQCIFGNAFHIDKPMCFFYRLS